MKLTVPFLYEAIVINPRCRNSVSIVVRDEVDIEIKEVSILHLPIALKVKKTEYRWDGDNLWDYDYETICGVAPRKVTLDEVVKYTNDCDLYRWSGNGPAAPFHNFWSKIDIDYSHPNILRSAWLKDDNVYLKEEIKVREWLSDNRSEVIEFAKNIASNCQSLDGVMITKTNEPRYVSMTFGLGRNHGGTALMLDSYYNGNIARHAYFRADQLTDAIKYTGYVATRRGDTNYLPIVPHNEIEVLIPEALQLEKNDLSCLNGEKTLDRQEVITLISQGREITCYGNKITYEKGELRINNGNGSSYTATNRELTAMKATPFKPCPPHVQDDLDSGFKMTDEDDGFQRVKRLDDWSYIYRCELEGNTFEQTIDVREIDQEAAIDGYYKSVIDVIEQYTKDANMIIAECEFEGRCIGH